MSRSWILPISGEILVRLECGEAKRALARAFNVSAFAIYEIAKGKTWRHISLGVA